jgi:predicted alpha/beta-fold hydrolase
MCALQEIPPTQRWRYPVSERIIPCYLSLPFDSALDFCPSTKDARRFKDDTPVVVVLHGLTGGLLLNVLFPSHVVNLARVS